MNERINKFDELRGLAIIGVVAIHTASHDIGFVGNEVEYWFLAALTMLCRFAVPCFLIISGFFISFKEEQNNVTILQNSLLSRFSRIIPPYIFWSSLYFLLFVLTGVQYSRAAILIFFEQLLTGTIASQLYFIVLIVQMYMLSYIGFMRNGIVSRRSFVLIIIAFLAFIIPSYLLTVDDSAMPMTGYYFKMLERSCFPRWLIYFAVGRWMGAHWSEIKCNAAQHRKLLFGCLMTSVIICFLEFIILRHYCTNVRLLPPDWMFSCLFFGVLFSVWFLTSAHLPDNISIIIRQLGYSSFGIYLLHEPFLGMLMRSVYFSSNIDAGLFLCLRQLFFIAIGIVVPLALMSLIRRVLPSASWRYILG